MCSKIAVRKREPETWTDFCQLRWSGVDQPKSRLGKVGLERFLAKNNLPRSKILRRFDWSSEIDLGGLPDSFVLKPESLWSAKGVMLLHRVAGLNLYYDAKAGVARDVSSILSECCRVEAGAGRKIGFIIEERVFDEDSANTIPFDYKVFTFYGVTKFVLQVDRNHEKPKICFFDGDFCPINDERVYIPKKKEVDSRADHSVPQCAEGILELARDITLRLEASFISVDCYATPSGPVFGELTHTPGGPWFGSMYRFSKEFDLELGQEWRSAYERLGLEVPMIEVPYEIKFNGKPVRYIPE
jgi:hypothetical protein